MKNLSYALLGLLTSFTVNAGELRLNPNILIFGSPTVSIPVQIIKDGTPMNSANTEISVAINRDGMDQTNLFSITLEGTKIHIVATHAEKLATYELVINIDSIKAYGVIETPLSKDRDVLEPIAKKYGVTVDELLTGKGISISTGEFQTKITLPDYYYGQEVRVALGNDFQNYIAEWKVQGQDVTNCNDPLTLSYIPKEIGNYKVELLLRSKLTKAVASRWNGTFNVKSEDVIVLKYNKNTTILFSAPDLYETYSWTVNGQPITPPKTTTELPVHLSEKGLYTVEVMMTSPRSDETQPFRKIAWEVLSN